jgi:hypothetical protein
MYVKHFEVSIEPPDLYNRCPMIEHLVVHALSTDLLVPVTCIYKSYTRYSIINTVNI